MDSFFNEEELKLLNIKIGQNVKISKNAVYMDMI